MQRYHCSRAWIAHWISMPIAKDQSGAPCTVLVLLEQYGYRKKQSYYTHKQWSIITEHLDPFLKPDEKSFIQSH